MKKRSAAAWLLVSSFFDGGHLPTVPDLDARQRWESTLLGVLSQYADEVRSPLHNIFMMVFEQGENALTKNTMPDRIVGRRRLLGPFLYVTKDLLERGDTDLAAIQVDGLLEAAGLDCAPDFNRAVDECCEALAALYEKN